MSDTSAVSNLSFQQTPSARVRDPGPPSNANPPPPPPATIVRLQEEPSPHQNRGQSVNITI